MQKTTHILACLAVITAYSCGSVECSPEGQDRTGIYLVESKTISGNCGDMDSSLVNLSTVSATSTGGDCTIDFELWSDDECKVEREATCTFPSDDLTATFLIISEQENDAGSRLTGTMTTTMRSISTGNFECSGTYEMRYTRQ
jgi:hypothetical protein